MANGANSSLCTVVILCINIQNSMNSCMCIYIPATRARWYTGTPKEYTATFQRIFYSSNPFLVIFEAPYRLSGLAREKKEEIDSIIFFNPIFSQVYCRVLPTGKHRVIMTAVDAINNLKPIAIGYCTIQMQFQWDEVRTTTTTLEHPTLITKSRIVQKRRKKEFRRMWCRWHCCSTCAFSSFYPGPRILIPHRFYKYLTQVIMTGTVVALNLPSTYFTYLILKRKCIIASLFCIAKM